MNTKRVFVSNVPYEMKWQDLKDLFRKEGELFGVPQFFNLFYHLISQYFETLWVEAEQCLGGNTQQLTDLNMHGPRRSQHELHSQ